MEVDRNSASLECATFRLFTWRCDSRYDDAGDVIETHEHTGEFKALRIQ
jgi:hypothetical protein